MTLFNFQFVKVKQVEISPPEHMTNAIRLSFTRGAYIHTYVGTYVKKAFGFFALFFERYCSSNIHPLS